MSFFYADIKTDELKVHGHTNSIPGQIEILDAASSNMVILKAPNVLAGNVTLTLPAENAGSNNILTTTDGSGTLGFVTASGDLTLGSSGAFTVNGISNTSTIQSTANIVLAGTNSLYFADSNVGLRAPDNGNLVINAASNVILEKGSSHIVFDIGATNSYINFSNVVGDLGYGIKSSNGIMQYKNTADAGWSNIGSGGGGGSSTLAGLTDVTLSGLANNNILVYDTSDSKWHNEAITSGYYGAFSDTTTQTNNTAASPTGYNVMRFNTTDESYGVSVVNNSQITVAHSGVYNIQFSAQLDKTDSGTDNVNIWLVKNGVAVPNTDTSVSLTDNNAKAVAAWNFVLSLAANDYVELAWKSADPDLRIYAQAAGSPNPAIPSVIATVTQQAFVLGGTSNFFAELLDVNTAGKTGNSLVQYNVATSKWDAVSNLTLNNGNYIKLGNTGNIVGSNGGNVTINGGNVDIIVSGEAHVHNNLRVTGNIFGPPNGGNLTINSGNVDIVVSGEAHVHNNLRVTGNIFLDGNNLSNISAPVGGNLNISASNVNILSTSETKITGPVRLANTLYFDGGYLANISSPSAGNLVINSGNLDIIPSGYLNIQGNTLIAGSNILAFGDQSTYINSNATGNLDIRATAGNVNITANHDIVLTTNSASTIRLVGPNGSSPVNISFAGSCSYINFGSITGDTGAGIKYDGANVAVGSGGSWSGISNTSISIAGRAVALGESTTMDLNDLNDVVVSGSILANSVITYDSGDSLWKNRKLYIGDLSGISITGTPATSNVLISDGTNFINRRPLYSDISGNADTITFNSGGLIAFNGSRVRIGNSSTSTGTQSANAIAIGNLAGGSVGQGESAIAIGTMAGNSGVAQPANSLVINSSGITLNASGTSRTHIAPIRQDQSQTSAVMMYNTATKEVVYNDRVKDYILLTYNGDIADGTYTAGSIRNPFIDNPNIWRVPPTTTTFSNNNIAFSNSTGSFMLPSLTRLYKVSFKLAMYITVTANDATPQPFVQLISGPSSNIVVNRLGILVQDTTVSTITDCYISGVSNIYVAFGNETTTVNYNQDINDAIFTVDITEV